MRSSVSTDDEVVKRRTAFSCKITKVTCSNLGLNLGLAILGLTDTHTNRQLRFFLWGAFLRLAFWEVRISQIADSIARRNWAAS